jgi:hypothetical protein
VWRDVANRMAAHRVAGRGHLLTEDVVRMETVLALDSAGVPASRLTAEVPAAELNGGKLDLTVDGSTGTIIEFKYPRDSRSGISPDTMTFGELVRDFLRVAAVAADDRWVVQVLNPRLVRYLINVQRRHALAWTVTEGETLTLHPEVIVSLPETAGRAIAAALLPGLVVAECVVAAPIDAGLALYAYSVAAATEPARLPPSPRPTTATGAWKGTTKDGARGEILASARRVLHRSGGQTFSMNDIITDMRTQGSGYAEGTIRTMLTSHLCADSSGPGIAGYSDFRREGHGIYRFNDEF